MRPVDAAAPSTSLSPIQPAGDFTAALFVAGESGRRMGRTYGGTELNDVYAKVARGSTPSGTTVRASTAGNGNVGRSKRPFAEFSRAASEFNLCLGGSP